MGSVLRGIEAILSHGSILTGDPMAEVGQPVVRSTSVGEAS